MSSVAVNYLATVTSKGLGSSQTTKQASVKDFNKVLEKIVSSKDKGVSENNTVKASKTEYEDNNLQKSEPDDQKDVKVDEPNSKSEPETTDIKDVEEKVIKEVAKVLDISEEELSEIMATLNLTIMDLFTKEGLQQLLNQTLGVSSETDLLLDSEVFAKYKGIMQEIDKILDETPIDLELQPNQDQQDVKDQESIHNEITEITEMVDMVIVPNEVQAIHAMQNMNTKQTMTENQKATNLEVTTETKTTEIEVLDLRTEEVVAEPTKSENSKDNTKDSSSENNFQSIFTNTITQKTNVEVEGIKEIFTQVANAREVIDQIVTNVKATLTDNTSEMVFQLKPENLGKIAFAVASENGIIKGQFVAESTAVKEAIEMNMANLKTTLNEQGIKVENIEVVVGNTNQFFEKKNQEQNMSQFAKNKRKKLVSMDVIEGIDKKIQDLRDSLNLMGLEEQNSVNFTA